MTEARENARRLLDELELHGHTSGAPVMGVYSGALMTYLEELEKRLRLAKDAVNRAHVARAAWVAAAFGDEEEGREL